MTDHTLLHHGIRKLLHRNCSKAVALGQYGHVWGNKGSCHGAHLGRGFWRGRIVVTREATCSLGRHRAYT